MKFRHVFSGAIAIALAATAITSAAATTPDASAYGYLTGKAGRIEEVAPYAGMNYEGGERGDTSGYSYQTGRFGKPWNTAE